LGFFYLPDVVTLNLEPMPTGNAYFSTLWTNSGRRFLLKKSFQWQHILPPPRSGILFLLFIGIRSASGKLPAEWKMDRQDWGYLRKEFERNRGGLGAHTPKPQ
jgi:hypothetical protein